MTTIIITSITAKPQRHFFYITKENGLYPDYDLTKHVTEECLVSDRGETIRVELPEGTQEYTPTRRRVTIESINFKGTLYERYFGLQKEGGEWIKWTFQQLMSVNQVSSIATEQQQETVRMLSMIRYLPPTMTIIDEEQEDPHFWENEYDSQEN